MKLVIIVGLNILRRKLLIFSISKKIYYNFNEPIELFDQ